MHVDAGEDLGLFGGALRFQGGDAGRTSARPLPRIIITSALVQPPMPISTYSIAEGATRSSPRILLCMGSA